MAAAETVVWQEREPTVNSSSKAGAGGSQEQLLLLCVWHHYADRQQQQQYPRVFLTNIAIEKGSTTTPLATAIHAEAVKSKLYSELPPIIGATLIPFALESTGALSPAALKFIKSLSVPEDSPDALFYFMGNINRIIARSQAAMMQSARTNGASHGAF